MPSSVPVAYIYDAGERRWLRFSSPLEIIQAFQPGEVLPALRRVEAGVQRGLCAAGFLSYEAAPAFDAALAVTPPTTQPARSSADTAGELGPPSAPSGSPALPERLPQADGEEMQANAFPLLWFALYTTFQIVTLPEDADASFMLGEWIPSVSPEQYDAAIAEIKEAIARGDTYQVNYTMRLRAPFSGDPLALFLQLERSQQTQFAAFLDIGEHAICSASPELFFTADAGHIVSKPMKGTAARGLTLAADRRQAEWLYASEKDRAENVMIVDMIRNDLGRIAQTGSVHVSRLFEVERYPTVWQMTSTVEARSPAGLADIFTALFPCASITGAPKVSTMRYIAALETAPRRIYTGALGFVIGKRAQFNVAIRTVLIDRKTGLAEYGVGGGIVWDSTPAGEYEECRIKTRLLTQPRPRFALLESLLWVPTGEYYLHDAHLRRLAESAEYFGFPFQDENVRSALVDAAADLFAAPHKVRMLLFIDGRIEISASPLEPAPPGTDIPDEPGASRADVEPVELRLAAGPVTSSDPFLYHKTTNRQAYAVARRGLPPGCEAVFYNERGELTESEIANLVLRIGGQLLTPPVSAGLLPGVMRAHLLARGEIEEAPLHIDDLARAEEIYLINSVRKWRLGKLASISV